jgi:hypothetical protein
MLASSTNKTDRHNLTEILLNVALNINLNQTNQSMVRPKKEKKTI